MVGMRSIVTSADTHNTLRDLIDILGEADSFSRDALVRVQELVDRAEAASARTASTLNELHGFLEQFSLESGISSGDTRNPTFLGGIVDLDAMRADVSSMSLNASKADVLARSLRSLRNAIENADRHFSSDAALTTPLDATSNQFQAAVTGAQEEERERLAREVHDGPAQVMANAIYAVQVAEQVAARNPESMAEELSRLRDLLKEGLTEVRRFMFDLRPAMLAEYGLAATVQHRVDHYERYFGRRVSCDIRGDLPTLAPDAELNLFRIIQEALQNAHKYAGNEAAVEVQMCMEPPGFVIRVSDNGLGFDPALVSPKLASGAGLLGMRKRAALLRAQLSIESQLGKGTVITLVVPVDAQPGLESARSA
jgi:two-component system sensor histidine kinase DegS